ncbi:putative zn 2cys6 transcription factor protein [Emericellopsis cladophorae]|uniref:Zn 2cys6 transcription factor protein n=1 Tax=Emericellopsis cladophorae TaxID=2686198 RepID=A0A9Q0B934_9HYPO|nr:putative zn 2cys6 transcription factor protein [Emericellopsis cladophorae]KAI6778277.1 putative zn 2cys6 transcription factor protein [Emericellopsis cladophorae]
MNSAAAKQREADAVKESAPYGKACAGCVRAKCKCVLQPQPRPSNSRTCERCVRLQKDCVAAPVVRKRVNRTAKGRTAKLEEKLDSLVSLLSQQGQQQQTPHPHSQPTSDYASRYGSEKSDSVSHEARDAASPEKQQQNADPPMRGAPSRDMNTDEDDARCLRLFRENYLPSFPYFHVAERTTPADLQREYPFLWRVMQATCASSTGEQMRLERELRQETARALLIDLERDMDHLLGLIGYVSWLHSKFRGKPTLNVFGNLARSMMFDLHLDRHATELPCRELEPGKAYGCPVKKAVLEVVWTNVERRAVLGCYIMCACLSWFIKTAAVGWTPHMDMCLQALAAQAESDQDHVLVAIARITTILEEVNALSMWRPAETRPACQASLASGASPGVHVKTLRGSLETMKSATPPEVLENKYVVSHLSAVEAMIYELALHHTPLTNNWVAMTRTTALTSCLAAAARCMDNFLAFTPAQVSGHASPIHLHFSAMTHIIYRLCLQDDPCWDRAQILQTVDLLGTLERAAVLYGAVPAAVGLVTDEDDVYTRGSEMIRGAVIGWRRTFEEVGALTPSEVPEAASTAPLTWGPELDAWLMDWASGGVEDAFQFS